MGDFHFEVGALGAIQIYGRLIQSARPSKLCDLSDVLKQANNDQSKQEFIGSEIKNEGV